MIGSVRCAALLVWWFSREWCNVQGSRVLVVVPTPIHSHQVVFRPFTQQLVRRGHQVVVITTDPAFPSGQAPQNLTEIDLHDISYKLWTEKFHKAITGKPSDYNTQIKTAYEIMMDIFPEQMQTEQVRELLENKSQQFDLVVVEAWVYQALALAHVYHAPSILMSTLGIEDEMYEDIGVPTHPIIHPDVLRTRRYNLSAWEQAKVLYNRYDLHRIFKSLVARQDVLNKKVFGADMPPLEEMRKNVELQFVNMHPVWEGYRPMPLSVVHLGGLNCAPPKNLPEEFQTLMDSSKRGVIYMSFGSNANPSLLPPERLEVFARVFATLDYDVFWKWKGAPQSFSSNVRTFSWLPQPDLLRHEKLVLFITQGGLQSTDEALRAGVPLLGIPLVIDQWVNVENYERLGVGKRLDLYSLTESQLREAIETLINDKSYRENSAQLGRQMEDQPQTTLARAVLFAERVMRLRGRRFPTPPFPLTWDDIINTLLLAFLIIPVTLIFLAIGIYKTFTKLKFKVVGMCRRWVLRARGYSNQLLPRAA